MAAPSSKTSMAKANKALAIASKLQASREKKFVVTSLSASVDQTGTILTVNDPEQGLGDSSRVGDRITCRQVSCNLWRVIPGSASGRFSLRFILFIDKQNAITSPSQVLLGTDSNFTPLNHYVKDYRKRFVILYDSGANHMDQYNKGMTTRFSQRVNLHTQFNAGTATINTGAIKLLAISNQGSSSNQRPLLIGSVRVDYTDS